MAESLCTTYRRAVKRRLICPAADRTRLTARLEAMTAAFAEEHPSATSRDWYSTFGSPETLAGELLAECDPLALDKARRSRRWLTRGTIALMAVLVVAFGAIAFYAWKTGGGYTEIETRIYVTGPIPTPPPPGATAIIRYCYDD